MASSHASQALTSAKVTSVPPHPVVQAGRADHQPAHLRRHEEQKPQPLEPRVMVAKTIHEQRLERGAQPGGAVGGVLAQLVQVALDEACQHPAGQTGHGNRVGMNGVCRAHWLDLAIALVIAPLGRRGRRRKTSSIAGDERSFPRAA